MKKLLLTLCAATALPGVAAAAFHGLIRTAHAVQSGHAGEVAAALAYWAWRWQPLAPARVPAERSGGQRTAQFSRTMQSDDR